MNIKNICEYFTKEYYFNLKQVNDKKILFYNKIVKSSGDFSYLALSKEDKIFGEYKNATLEEIEKEIIDAAGEILLKKESR